MISFSKVAAYLKSDLHLRRISVLLVFFLMLGTYLGNWASTIGEILLFCLGVFLIGVSFSNKERLFANSISLSAASLGIFVLACLVSVMIYWEEYEAPLDIVKKIRHHCLPLICLGLYGLSGLLLKSANLLLKWGGITLATSAVLATCSGLIGHWAGWNPLLFDEQPDPKRASGIFGLVMTYAYSMQMTFLLFCAVFFRIEQISQLLGFSIAGRKRIWALAVIGIVVLVLGVGIFFSYTRGAYLGAGVGLVVLAILRKSHLLSFCVVTAAVIGICIALSSGSRIFSSKGGQSDSVRVSQWRASSLAFLSEPSTGIGYRRFGVEEPDLKSNFNLPLDYRVLNSDGEIEWAHYLSHAHNNYLEAFATTGVVGGLALCFFLFFWLREVLRSRAIREFFAPMIVAFVISGFFENTFYDSEVVCYLMVLYIASRIAISLCESERRAPRQRTCFK